MPSSSWPFTGKLWIGRQVRDTGFDDVRSGAIGDHHVRRVARGTRRHRVFQALKRKATYAACAKLKSVWIVAGEADGLAPEGDAQVRGRLSGQTSMTIPNREPVVTKTIAVEGAGTSRPRRSQTRSCFRRPRDRSCIPQE